MPKLPEIVVPIPNDAGFAITEYLGLETDPVRANISVAIEYISKGVAKPRHYHKISEEIFHVVSGTGFLTIGDTEYPIAKGSTFLVEVGEEHFLRAADDDDLSVMLISAPAYEASDYIKC